MWVLPLLVFWYSGAKWSPTQTPRHSLPSRKVWFVVVVRKVHYDSHVLAICVVDVCDNSDRGEQELKCSR